MNIDDIFGIKKELDTTKIVCNSGGAIGSDTYFENYSVEKGIKVNAFSYMTKSHQSDNKVEISDSDYSEGILEIRKANRILNRYGIEKYMNLLARNWAQVKYSDEIFAVGSIIKSGEKDSRGYKNKSTYDIVSGGTGYATTMAILHSKPLYVFEQNHDKWFQWSYISNTFIMCKDPKITTQSFAGIGTREIKPNGIEAIKKLIDTIDAGKA